MASDRTKQGTGLLGLGAAACAACCAGPIFGVLASAGLLTVAAYLTVGVFGLAVTVPLALWLYRRRQARVACKPTGQATPVELTSRTTP